MAVLGVDAADRPASAARPSAPGGPQRPSVLARLLIRLEDWTNDDGPASLPEDAPELDPAARAHARKAASDAKMARNRAGQQTSLEDAAEAERLGRPPRAGGAGGAAPETVSRDDKTIALYVVPTEYDLELNTFREADKVTLTLPLRDLPILPEMVRSMLVEFFLSTGTAQGFGDPTQWAPRPLQKYLQFRGYADELDADAGDDFQVQLTAYSLEHVLMNKDINPLSKSRRIKGGSESLVSFLRRFFDTIPEFSGALGGSRVDVRFYPNVAEDAVPMLDRKLFNRTLQTAESRAQAAGGSVLPDQAAAGQDPAAMLGEGTPTVPSPAVGTKLKAWDVVIRAAELCGVIPLYDPSIDPNAILLVPPQNLYESPTEGIVIPGGPRDGFERTFLEGGTTLVKSQVRLFCWGRNVRKMRMSRRYGRNKPRAVQVVSYNPDARGKAKVIVARFPKTPRGTSASAAGVQGPGGPGRGHAPVDEIVTVTVRGLRDQAAAEQVAVALYHAMSKRELRALVETDDLNSFVDPNFPEDVNSPQGADLYRLRPGTPVRIVVARQQTDPSQGLVVNTLSEVFERRSNPAFLRRMLSEQQQRWRAFGGDADYQDLEEALRRVEEAYQSAKLTDWFFVKTARHKFSAESAYSFSAEVFNYVEARNNPANLSAGDAATNDAKKAKRPRAPKGDAAAKASREEAAREAATAAALDDLMRRSLGVK